MAERLRQVGYPRPVAVGVQGRLHQERRLLCGTERRHGPGKRRPVQKEHLHRVRQFLILNDNGFTLTSTIDASMRMRIH